MTRRQVDPNLWALYRHMSLPERAVLRVWLWLLRAR